MHSLTYSSPSTGETYDLDCEAISTDGALALRADAWSYDLGERSVSSARRSAREATVELTATDRAAYDAAWQAFDADMESGTPGTVEAAGGWTQSAYVAGWEPASLNRHATAGKATVLLLDGAWRRKTTVGLKAGSAESVTIGGLDFDFDLGWDSPGLPAEPVFTAQPSSVVADPRTAATLSAHAVGYRLAYAWQQLAGGAWAALGVDTADTSALTLPRGQTGTYRLRATDAFGRSAYSEPATVSAASMADDTPFDMSCDLGDAADWTMPAAERLESFTGTGGELYDEPGIDLGADIVGSRVDVSAPSGALLGIRFSGPCSSPYVSIGGNTYGVDAYAAPGETIAVDPLGRDTVGGSVFREDRYGNRSNLYARRRRGYEGSGSYVFQRLRAGSWYASWPQDVDVELDVIEERGMPPWS